MLSYFLSCLPDFQIFLTSCVPYLLLLRAQKRPTVAGEPFVMMDQAGLTAVADVAGLGSADHQAAAHEFLVVEFNDGALGFIDA